MVDVGRIVLEVGETEIEKSPCGGGACAWTTSVPDAVRVVAPLVPMTVNGYDPGATPLVETVSVEDPAPFTNVGENAPFGNPLWVKSTSLEKPPVALTVTLNTPLAPTVTVELDGETPTEKSC